MHTLSMDVKTISNEKRAQGDATRLALVVAARELFGERGYAPTSIDEVASRAGVTKGAFYHHFAGKADLFQEVYEQVKREVSDQVVSVFNEPDHWKAVIGGCQLMIDAQPEHVAAGTVCPLGKAVYGGVVERQPLRPLALLLAGALSEACFYVADADDPAAAREEVGRLIERILEGLKVSPEPRLQVAGPAHTQA